MAELPAPGGPWPAPGRARHPGTGPSSAIVRQSVSPLRVRSMRTFVGPACLVTFASPSWRMRWTASATPLLLTATLVPAASTVSPARSAAVMLSCQFGAPGAGDSGGDWLARKTWSIRRSSRVVARLACSMSPSAAIRRSGEVASTLRATAARTVIRPRPWDTRSWRSRAIVSRSAATAAATCEQQRQQRHGAGDIHEHRDR